ncbi:MAG: ATP-binding protein [Candidatus Omnitrophica bacterium]|nr:ATP-binding protein [Candidatus Omnitrophota bacterium]
MKQPRFSKDSSFSDLSLRLIVEISSIVLHNFRIMWIERDISKALILESKQRPVLLLTGARQTGKTSLARETFKNYGFVSLDLPRLAEEAEESGEQFLAKYKTPLIIDEVQYAPALFRYLKSVVDSRRNETGLYILTGSQKFSLMAGVGESLAGRVGIFDLHSLSLEELERFGKKKAEGKQLLEWMLRGGYPELNAKSLDADRFYSDYVTTYLERDVRQVLQIRSLRDFDRFLRLAALRTSQILSLNSLASDVGVSPNTIKSWLSILEASQIVYLLEPYYQNLGKRLVKTPKLYFLDTGLACFLAGLRTAEDIEKSALLGALYETLALGQIIRWHANRGKQAKVYFYRDHSGLEMDFVIPVGDRLKLYECKWAEQPGEVKGFRDLTELIGEKKVLSKSIISPVRGIRKRSDGVLIEDCVKMESLGKS